MKYRAIGILLLAFFLVFGLMACSSDSGQGGAEESRTETEPAPETGGPEKTGGGSEAVDHDPIKLRLGNTFASGSASVINDELEQAAARISARTDGGVTIEIFGDSLLGSEAEMYESLFMGSLEMVLESIAFQSTSHPELIIEDLPYMFSTREDGYRALDGEYGQAINDIISASGEVRNLGFIELGFRHVTNNIRPIETPEDMAGIKIRTTSSDLRRAVFEEMGAMTVSMGFNELFTALQQKVVDGQETPLTTINSSSLYEVQDYLSLTGHFWTNECVLINEEIWQSIPEPWQEIVQEEIDEAVQRVRERIVQEDEELIEVMREKGMQVNEVDKALFAEALSSLYDRYEREVIGPELMDIYRQYSGY